MSVTIPAETRALLLDIEGTTTSIAFVYEVLFPFAKARMGDFLQAHWEEAEVQADVALVRAQAQEDLQAGREDACTLPEGLGADAREATLANLMGQIAADRKTTGLKSLQGKVWVAGYESGTLLGHLYDDVAPALRGWRAAGLSILIYSSGSVAAQRLLFGHSVAGDLTPLLDGYFDTTTGPKKEAASYGAIAEKVGLEPRQITFLSDSLPEVEAAQRAGLGALVSLRPGNPALPTHAFPSFRSFAELRVHP
jgi:enolase-phosphatase E1